MDLRKRVSRQISLLFVWIVCGILNTGYAAEPGNEQKMLKDETEVLGQASLSPTPVEVAPFYRIGPKDSISIFVWGHPDLSTGAAVRPDGRISVPLVEDLPVTGKTPTELAREMEKILSKYVRDPLVTVIVSGFLGPYERQIRILGEATRPQSMPFIEGMTVLDLMIQVGGITDFAAGNRTKLIRIEDGMQKQYTLRLDDLIREGDISANVDLLPGDILIIPESWF